MGKTIGASVLVLVGVFFAFFPHRVHVSLGFTFPHVYHVSFGIACLVIGGWLFMKMKKV